MKLNAIFVGKPITVNFQGREVETSIYKELVTGSVKVNALNIEGDKQADLTVHGGVDKAVYTYPSEHYDFWKERRPDLTFELGTFGENLSISGLDEKVCIGDVFQIGTTVFAITIPRMPCFKLGIKMGDSGFVRDFMKEGRNGWYFKVLKEGSIEAGNEIKKIDEDGYNLSIKEVIELYTIQKKNKTLLEKAINSPSLPQDWIDYFEVKMTHLK